MSKSEPLNGHKRHLGVGFDTISSLLAPHLGILWEKYKAEYPNCEEKPPLFTKGAEVFSQLTDEDVQRAVWGWK